ADAEVEQKGARYVRDDGRACCEADAALLEPAHDAVDRFLAEPAAAAEDDAVDRRDQVAGAEVVEADDVVGASAQLDTARPRPVASKTSAISASRRAQRRRASGPSSRSMTRPTIASSRSALTWSETTSRLSRAARSSTASTCTASGSRNQPAISGSSASAAERSTSAGSAAGSRG